jgi:predicted secreted Zn-dependent protease
VPLPREIDTDEREVPYRVTGSTAAELRRSMLSAGPEEEGGTWYGYTTWHVRWRYDYAAVAGGCEIQEVDVSFRSRVRLPRWDPPDDADEELVSAWRAFVDALREHEYGHRDIGARAARDILRRLRSLRRDRCDGMEERANTLAHRILDRYREREEAYDRRTNHGERQGAVWPPE